MVDQRLILRLKQGKKELDLNLNCRGQYDDKKIMKKTDIGIWSKVSEPNNSSLNLIFFDFRNDQCHTKSERNNIKYILVNYKKHLIYIFFSWFSHGLWTSRYTRKCLFLFDIKYTKGQAVFFSFLSFLTMAACIFVLSNLSCFSRAWTYVTKLHTELQIFFMPFIKDMMFSVLN